MVIVIDCYLLDGTVYESTIYEDGDKFNFSNVVFHLSIPEIYNITKIIISSWNGNDHEIGILKIVIYENISENTAKKTNLPVKIFIFDNSEYINAVRIIGYTFFKFPKIRPFTEPAGWRII